MRSVSLLFLIVVLLLPGVAPAGTCRVLFDQGHGQAFTIEKEGELQLGRLASLFRAAGCQAESTTGVLTPSSLVEVDALIISGAFKPLAEAELAAIGQFLHQGGRLAVMLHIAPPLSPLLGKLGVVSANGVVREGELSRLIGGEPLNFRVDNLAKHPLTDGLEFLSLYGGWPLLPEGEHVRSIASTGPTAWVDLNRDEQLSLKDAVQEFSVVVAGPVGQGEFAVFADDAIFQNRFLTDENEKLAENLVRWLMQGRAVGLQI